MAACMQSREHQYLFEPVWASVLLRRNTSKEPLRSRHTPRIEGLIQLEPMSLRLTQVRTFPDKRPEPTHHKQTTAFNKYDLLALEGAVPADHGVPQRARPSGEGVALQEVEAQCPCNPKVRHIL